ncbi:AAA family ATPase [Lederbergia sp. NSJ-179]|uniref:ATP-binding protein n=1 Tax=Lederbergia sp. NSJ-179 TaxID=2931402 RepID=UPI001FD1B554|nr:AAA family ATPase [Lederbergia sp. NSJ-179]MCJ7842336.1 AAA family ATPase [Lederbergia sp. NSJ-179]
MKSDRVYYPFTAIVGQENMKLALLLNSINPAIGGVLIKGEKGTAKSTAVRSLADLFGYLKVVELPLNATEDRVVGTLDIEQAIKYGEKKFEAGILFEAHKQILYIDEINLLDDHLVDILLDVSAMGVNTIEREGISYAHPAQFILIGTMNPEEGDLRPQLLDRFGLSVEVRGEQQIDRRVQVLQRRLAFEENQRDFQEKYRYEQEQLVKRVKHAKEILPEVNVSDDIYQLIARLSIQLKVDGHRSDLTVLKAAVALAAFEGRTTVTPKDIQVVTKFVYPHRMKRTPFHDEEADLSNLDTFLNDMEIV